MCVKSFQMQKFRFFSSVYILIGEDNLAYSFYLHLKVRFEKAEHNTHDALRPLTALCPLQGSSKSSLALGNPGLSALRKHRARGCCWR